MTEQMPKDIVVRLRQIAAAYTRANDIEVFPEWFKRQHANNPREVWITLVSTAADELEQMQQLNGRLLRRLAGD